VTTVEVLTKNVTELDAAGIVTVAGTDKGSWLLANTTVSGVPAGLSSEAVQALEELLPSFDATHDRPVNCAVAAETARVKACALPQRRR